VNTSGPSVPTRTSDAASRGRCRRGHDRKPAARAPLRAAAVEWAGSVPRTRVQPIAQPGLLGDVCISGRSPAFTDDPDLAEALEEALPGIELQYRAASTTAQARALPGEPSVCRTRSPAPSLSAAAHYEVPTATSTTPRKSGSRSSGTARHRQRTRQHRPSGLPRPLRDDFAAAGRRRRAESGRSAGSLTGEPTVAASRSPFGAPDGRT
jgi:hypothetical protein